MLSSFLKLNDSSVNGTTVSSFAFFFFVLYRAWFACYREYIWSS